MPDTRTQPRLTLIRPSGSPLVVCSGDLVAIVGDSGAGKTTLLERLEAEVASCRRWGWSNRSRNGHWIIHRPLWDAAQPVVVVPQENELVYAGLRTIDNVVYYQRQLDHDPGLEPDEALALVKLDDALLRDRKAGRLSSGEKRRLLLAMDLALQPAVLAADEPLSQLDSGSADWVFHLLQNYAREVAPVLMTVHRPIDRWIEHCTQVWVVERNEGVTVAMSGEAFLEAFRALWEVRRRVEPVSGGRLGLERVWQGCGFRGGSIVPGGEVGSEPVRPPAVHYVLEHLESFKETVRAGTDRSGAGESSGGASIRDVDGVDGRGATVAWGGDGPAGGSRRRSREGRAAQVAAQVATGLRHEFILHSNLKFWKYWLLVLGLISLVFVTNFLGDADRLPFAVTRTSVALLVAALFISTVNSARLWVDHEADRIRQRCLRGMNPFLVAVSRLVPGLVEGVVFAGLVFAVWWILSGRLGPLHWLRHVGVWLEGSVGLHTLWPDGLATFSGLPWLPVLVPLLVYVSMVGCLQGLVISLWVGRRQLLGWGERSGGGGFIPGGGQVSAFVAALVVVAQIFLSGAFGHITTSGGGTASRAFGSAVDWLAGLSPVRWAYNAVVMQEWREARCSAAKTPCRYGSWYAPTFIQGCLDPALLSRYTGADANRLEIRTLDRSEVTDPTHWWDCDERKAGAWYVPVGELENVDASDAVRKWVTLKDLGAPIPIGLIAEQVGSSQFEAIEAHRRARLDVRVTEEPMPADALAADPGLAREFPLGKVRGFPYLSATGSGGPHSANQEVAGQNKERQAVQDLLCASRHAFLHRDLDLAALLVDRAMVRPLLVDVEYCWRTCPRLSRRGLETCSEDALEGPLRYPAWTGGVRRCSDEPLQVFLATRAEKGTMTLADLVRTSCAERLFPLTRENRQILFDMAVVLLLWAVSVFVLTERWYRALGRERRGGPGVWVLAFVALAVWAPHPAAAQILNYRQVEIGDDLAVQIALRCTRDHLTASLAPGTSEVLVTGMGDPKSFPVSQVREAAPDDLPLDLYFYVPVDLTMLDSHHDLLQAVAEVPAMMRTLGHRSHHYYFYTYSMCAGDGQAVTAVHHGPYNRGYYLARRGEVGGLQEMLSRIPQDRACSYPGRRKLFQGVNVHDALQALLSLLEDEGTVRTHRRPRILLMVAEGRNRTVGPGGEVDLDRLETMFDQVILFQPDIAPVQFAIHQKKLGRIGGLNAAIVRRYRLERKREKGCESVEGPARCYESIEQEAANVAAVLEENPGILSGAFGGRRFISRIGLTQMIASLTGREKAPYLARIARDVDLAIPRPRGLDCLALALRDRGIGDLVVVGGRKETRLECPGRAHGEGGKSSARAAASMTEALMELSPFAQARVIQGCFREGRLSRSVVIQDRVTVSILVKQGGGEAVCTTASFLPDEGGGPADPGSSLEVPGAQASSPVPIASSGEKEEPWISAPGWARLACAPPSPSAIGPPPERTGIPPVAVLAGAVLGFLLGWMAMGRRRP